MGKNYYLRSKEPTETIVTHAGDIDGDVTHIEYVRAECHLCKLSWGWMPLMACDHESPIAQFESVREMMDFIRADLAGDNLYSLESEEIESEDEYGNYTYEHVDVDEFEKLVYAWGKTGGFPPFMEDGKTPREHGIYHVEYARQNHQHLIPIDYTVDDEGFEFEHREFC